MRRVSTNNVRTSAKNVANAKEGRAVATSSFAALCEPPFLAVLCCGVDAHADDHRYRNRNGHHRNRGANRK